MAVVATALLVVAGSGSAGTTSSAPSETQSGVAGSCAQAEMRTAAPTAAWACVQSYSINGVVHTYGDPGFVSGATMFTGGLISQSVTIPMPTNTVRRNAVRRAAASYSWSFGATVDYGQGGVTEGSNYETAGINLNGRQSQVKMSITVLSGPTIRPTLSWACSDCGSGGASSASYVASYSLPSGQSGFSTFDGQYSDTFTWSYTAAGYTPRFTNPVVASSAWFCNALYTPNCQFN